MLVVLFEVLGGIEPGIVAALGLNGGKIFLTLRTSFVTFSNCFPKNGVLKLIVTFIEGVVLLLTNSIKNLFF